MSKLTQRTAFFPLAVFCLLTGLFVQILVTSPTFAADDTNYESIVTKAAEADADESEWLTPEGGTLKFNSMGVTLKAPRGAVKEPVLVTLHPIRPGAGHSISQVFELTAYNRNEQAINKFDRPVVLSVKLQSSFESAKDKLYRWDDGRWVELKSDDRVSRGTVTGKTTLLGMFGVGR